MRAGEDLACRPGPLIRMTRCGGGERERERERERETERDAMIPLWLQYLQALAVTAIPAVGAWLAWQQVQIARVKLQHDLYDRRYRVFDATRSLLAKIGAKGNASDEDMRAFVLGTADAAFLFDDDLTRYLAEMGKHAVELQSIHSALENLVGQQKAQAIKVMSEKLWWFGDQLGRLIGEFEPFLKLDKRKCGVAWRLSKWRQSLPSLWRPRRKKKS